MDSNAQRSTAESSARASRRRRRWMVVLASIVVAACMVLAVAGEYVLHHAEPILRERVVETLAARFHAPVELDRLEISLFKGLEADGYGLRVSDPANTGPASAARPMIAVRHFAFRTGLRGLLRQPMHLSMVRVDGMELHIPPPDRRKEIREEPGAEGKIAIVVDTLECRDLKVFIESGRPGLDGGHKPPLEFDIATLDMRNVGRDQAMPYEAQLINPKPVGAIEAVGHFGPWGGTPASDGAVAVPGLTPIDGEYTFDHADLGTIKGVGGTLSSAGHFAGVLDRIAIDGHTETPNFSLDISNRPVPLHTDFHALVDGTSGDTSLEPVHARLANSDFTTSGKIVKVKGQGHDIVLDVDIPHGRMQDFLRLAVKTNPPLLDGTLTMKAKLHIPPGELRVPEKMSLIGAFRVAGVRFSNPRWASRVDGLSARAQGKPEAVVEVSHDHQAESRSQLGANFSMAHGVMSVTDLRYAIPGALVLLNGVYSNDGKLFEFRGRVRTDATASQMVGGWKGLLLSPFDRFLEKNGAGLELPIEISGTEGDVHFGLAAGGATATPREMLADVKGKTKARADLNTARNYAAEADAQDALAARAPTLEAAERAHAEAVRLRAAAQSRVAAREGSTGGPSR